MKCFSDIVAIYNEKIIKEPVNSLMQAFINDNPFSVEDLLYKKVVRVLNSNDLGINKEYAAHMFLLGSLNIDNSGDWMLQSQSNEGDGNPDITVYNFKLKRAIVIELKYAKAESSISLDVLVNQALTQIEDKHYYAKYENYDFVVSKWGIAFKGKSVKAALA